MITNNNLYFRVEDCKWNKINNKFGEEKIKIYPEFKNIEIHATELFNAPMSSTLINILGNKT